MGLFSLLFGSCSNQDATSAPPHRKDAEAKADGEPVTRTWPATPVETIAHESSSRSLGKCASPIGMDTVNVVPLPSWFDTATLPPCNRTSSCTKRQPDASVFVRARPGVSHAMKTLENAVHFRVRHANPRIAHPQANASCFRHGLTIGVTVRLSDWLRRGELHLDFALSREFERIAQEVGCSLPL